MTSRSLSRLTRRRRRVFVQGYHHHSFQAAAFSACVNGVGYCVLLSGGHQLDCARTARKQDTGPGIGSTARAIASRSKRARGDAGACCSCQGGRCRPLSQTCGRVACGCQATLLPELMRLCRLASRAIHCDTTAGDDATTSVENFDSACLTLSCDRAVLKAA